MNKVTSLIITYPLNLLQLILATSIHVVVSLRPSKTVLCNIYLGKW